MSPVKVALGQTVYAQYKFNRNQIEVKDERFDSITVDWNNRTATGDVASPYNIAPWLKMTTKDFNKGISVTLASAAVVYDVKKTTTTTSSVDISYAPITQVVLKITAAADMEATTDTGTLLFEGDGLKSDIPIFITVAK